MLTVARDGVLPLELLVTSGGAGQTGLSPVVAVRDAGTDGSYLDFADGAFKVSGWTTRQAALTEISAANAPGMYVRRVDLTTVTLPAGEHLAIEYSAPGHGASHELARLEPSLTDAVLLAQIEPHETTHGSVAQALAWLANGRRENITSQKLELRSRDGLAVIQSLPLITESGGNVTTQAGVAVGVGAPEDP